MKIDRLKNQNFIDYIPNIRYRDSKLYSPDYFQIFDIPDRIYLGKSSFRLNINLNNMVVGSRLFIELLDINDNPIYYSISDKKMDDRSKVVTIEIFDSTPNGIAKLYIAGKCNKFNGINIPVDDNLEIPNLLYIHQLLVVNSEITDDEIIFESEPSAKIGLIQYPLYKTSVNRETIIDNSVSSSHVIRLYEVGPIKAINYSSGFERVSSQFKNHFKISFEDFITTSDMVGGSFTINNLQDRIRLEYPKYDQYILDGNAHLIPDQLIGTVTSFGSNYLLVAFDFDLPVDVIGYKISSISDFDFEMTYMSNIDPTISSKNHNYLHIELKDLNLISGYCQDIEVSYKPYNTLTAYSSLGRHKILPESVFNYFQSPNSIIKEWTFAPTPINTYIGNPASDYFTLNNLVYTKSDRVVEQPKFKLDNELINGSLIQNNALTYYPIIYKLECNIHSHSNLPFILDLILDSKQVTTFQTVPDSREVSTIIGRVYMKDSNFQKVIIYFKPTVEISSKLTIEISATSDFAPVTIDNFKITPDYDIGVNPSLASFFIPIENFKMDVELEFLIKFLNNRGSYASKEIQLAGVRFDSGVAAAIIDKEFVGLENVDNTSDADKPISIAQQSELDLKAPVDNPTFTGTVSGVTKNHVGLSNVDNTSDISKPVSTLQLAALNAKYDNTNPNGYETPTQLNIRDTNNRARANHTGTQAISTIANLQTELDTRLTNTISTISSTNTLSVNFNNNFINVTNLSEGLTFSNTITGPVNKEITIMITDNNTAQPLTFASSWKCMNGSFPTSSDKKVTIIKAIRHSNGNIYCRVYQN